MVDGRDVYLSSKEFDVLYMLYSNPDVTFTKKQIYEAVWHEPAIDFCHAVENTVFQIRKRIKKCTNNTGFIKTVVGYHAEKQDGVTNQKIVIHYNCIGAFDVPDRKKIPEADIIMETRKGVAVSYAPAQIAV